MDRQGGNMVIGWKSIANYFGVSEWTVKNLFRRSGVKLPKIGTKGRTSPVYMIKGSILSATLKLGFEASVRRAKAD